MGESPRKVRSVDESIKQTLVLGLDAREQGVIQDHISLGKVNLELQKSPVYKNNVSV